MNIAIVTDDNARFSPEEAARLGIYVVPMPILIDGCERYENKDLTQEEFYRLQTSGHDIKTSQPAPGSVMAIWDEALKTHDFVLHIAMSSGLTQSVATAQMLAQDEKYAGKVFVVDNHRISITLRTSVYDALELIKEGKTAPEIRDWLEKTGHDSKIYIYVDTLEYLKKGGRITPAAAAMGQVLRVKPILKIEGGKLDAKAKVIGVRSAQQKLIDFILDDISPDGFFKGNKDNLAFCMAYTGDEAPARAMRERFAQALGINPRNIILDPLSLSVAVHIGPGAMATTATKVLNIQGVREAAEREFDLKKS